MLETVLLYASIGVASLIAFLNVIAPVTKTEWDNKLLGLLRKFEELVLKALVPQVRGMLKKPE